MNKIPDKVRVGIAIGLFLWSIIAIIMTIIYAYYHYELWIVIVIPILSFLAFILSIIFMPKSIQTNRHAPSKTKPRTHRPSYYSSKKKKPFISEKEWEELEEEEEECFAMEQADDDWLFSY